MTKKISSNDKTSYNQLKMLHVKESSSSIDSARIKSKIQNMKTKRIRPSLLVNISEIKYLD